VILVTGANGQLGRRIVQHLIAREPSLLDGGLGVSVRDAARATELASRGVIVRQADFDQPDSLAAAFAGIRRLVLVSTDGPAAQRSARHRRAIDAALAAGVSHILYTSFAGCACRQPDRLRPCPPGDGSGAGTQRRGPHGAAQHPYADDLRYLAEPALTHGVLRLPAGAGRVSLVSRDELAQAIAAATLAPRLDKRVYELTGQTALDYADIAARIARVSGRPLSYEDVSADAYAGSLVAQGVPAWHRRRADRAFSSASPPVVWQPPASDFAALVGHPPKSLDCLIHEYFAPRSPA
jgi:NAD(P)H dehydrogenase (quinone)